jgi:Reverse transcriptase (RNA-dependent DNA polymerase)
MQACGPQSILLTQPKKLHDPRPPYIVQDEARDQWITNFKVNLPTPLLTTDRQAIEQMAGQLTHRIEQTSIATFQPQHNNPIRCARWWNSDCWEVVTAIRSALSDKERWEANKNLRATIRLAKQKWANNFLSNATMDKLWAAARWRQGHCLHSIPALTTDSGPSNNTEEMALALRRRFFSNKPPIPMASADEPEALLQRAHHPISEHEISEVLMPTSNMSAPGKSSHGYKLIKWAWKAAPDWFVILFNSCLVTGHHPSAWRMATIAVVPKPGKSDYSLPKSYRPVALIECLSKLLEKVMAKRILHDIGEFSLVPTNQFGARPHSSTIHVGLALVHDINMTHAQGGCCTLLQFNIQGFFNSINHDRLVHLIQCLGFAANTCAWIASFLQDRSIQLCFNLFTSDPIDVPIGTPQGSPLSPVLSIMYTADLLHWANKWSDSHLFMFIDDGNILASGPCYCIVTNTLTKHFQQCKVWLEEAGLTIESKKTEVIFYSLTRPCPDMHGQCPASLSIPAEGTDTTMIQSTDTVQYLGLFINHKLTWAQHVNIMAMQTHSTLKALQLLGNSTRGLDYGNWRLAFNAICLPMLTYGSPVWFSGQKQLMATLQRVQDMVIRWIMGAFCTTPAKPLHQLCGILPMHLRLEMLSKNAALSLLSIPHNSQLIQHLGPPWCNAQHCDKNAPNLPFPPPQTALTHLTGLVPPKSRRAHNYNYGPWVRRLTTSDRLITDTNILHREDCKLRAREVAHSAWDCRADILHLFCHRACLTNWDSISISMAACTASYRGRIMEMMTKTLGSNASARDTAFHALGLATALAIQALHEHRAIKEVRIHLSDPLIPAQCLDPKAIDQSQNTTNFAQAMTNILDSYQNLMTTISWLLPGKGLSTLARAKSTVAEAARNTSFDPNNAPPPATKDQIQAATHTEAINKWQVKWFTAPKQQLAYLALTSPPDGKIPPFI